ncbi:predicted protein [Postia placenta Mad-698-R]|nr:predicted protein [Postia placenta Mad-698-R]
MGSTQAGIDVYLAQFNYECYIYIAATAFYCYDYCLTFSDEVRFVWKARPSVIAALFYVFRYTALFNTVFMILGLHAWPSWQSDRRSYQNPLHVEAEAKRFIAAVPSSYARRWRLLPFVATLLLGLINPAISIYTFIINEPILITFPRLTCGLQTQEEYAQLYDKLIQGARGSSLLFDLVVLIITWTKLRVAAMDIRSQARVSVVLIRDTTFYFSLQLIVNILGISIGSLTSLLIPMSTWIAILTSSLLSRLLFDLRKVSAEGLGVSITHTMGTLAFADAHSLGDDTVMDTPDVTSGRYLDEENRPRSLLAIPTSLSIRTCHCIEALDSNIPPPQNSCIMFPFPPSEMEANVYYAGLPSAPALVACTSTTPWEAPTGLEAYRNIKELRAVGNHALKEAWEDDLAKAPRPSGLDEELLVESNIADVDVEIRESVVTRSAGPKLLTPTYSSDCTVDVREPFTTTLGLPICAQSTPWVEDTGGFFISEGGKPERLLLVTARHVVFPPDKNENKHFEHKNDSQRCCDVRLFGDAAFKKYLESIKAGIGGKAIMAQYQERRIKAIEGKGDPAANRERQEAQAELDKAMAVMEELNDFYQNILTHWDLPESRVLGHVILSLPISSGEGYTEDWAAIEIDASKIDANNFNGNAIDLGTHIPVDEFSRMMCSNPRNAHSFTYPGDRLLKLKGTIPDDEMRHPTALDENNDPCLIVIKRGNTTNLTVGRASDICSYARIYDDNDKAETSKEWAILPFDSKSGPFSAKGDSGSVVVDGLGRIGGLLTSGAGATPSLDIAYATPISFLLKRMQENGLNLVNASRQTA